MWHVAVALSEALRSVWRPNAMVEAQPIRWCTESKVDARSYYRPMGRLIWRDVSALRGSDNPRDRGRRGRVARRTITMGDRQPWYDNCVMVDVLGSDHDGCIIALTFTDDVYATCLIKKE